MFKKKRTNNTISFDEAQKRKQVFWLYVFGIVASVGVIYAGAWVIKHFIN